MFRILHLAITGQLVPDNAEHVEYSYGLDALIVAQQRTDRDGVTRKIVDGDDNVVMTVTPDARTS